MVGDKDGSAEVPTIADDLVVTKYKMAAEIVNSEWDELETVDEATASNVPAGTAIMAATPATMQLNPGTMAGSMSHGLDPEMCHLEQ